MSESVEKKVSNLYDRVDAFLAKYSCQHHQLSAMDNPYGCTDYMNIGYIFDDEESYLLNELRSWSSSQELEIQELLSERKTEEVRVKMIEETLDLQNKEINSLKQELIIAVKYLKEGKAKFAPNTTNSLVDNFIEKYKDLKEEPLGGLNKE